MKYLFDNAFPTLNLPTNDRACPSSSKCENALYIPGNQNIRVILEPTAEISSGSNNHFNKIDQTRDQTSCSIQTDPYKEPCENKSTQTALHLSADTPIKRKLLLELREEKTRKSRSSPYSSYAPTLLEMDLNESSSSEQVDIKPFIHNPWFALNATPSPALDPKPPAIQNEDSSSSNAFTADENSSYFQFFRAIHSEFLELSPKKQRQFKRKCLVYLHELLDEEDNSHKRHGYSHQDNVLNLSNSGHMSEEEKDVKPVVEDGCIISSN
ncbi:unnamed protein product [Euphydryas editha]|uniref:BESS domain-containing protein n=1 Tax=Euphydryas editha TaxID=104508 RepID=A0AAU9U484_EUPED|nr:unnamed protein product [Euphydryas editha]